MGLRTYLPTRPPNRDNSKSPRKVVMLAEDTDDISRFMSEMGV